MFDIGFSELILVGIVALLVIGPERLPDDRQHTGQSDACGREQPVMLTLIVTFHTAFRHAW